VIVTCFPHPNPPAHAENTFTVSCFECHLLGTITVKWLAAPRILHVTGKRDFIHEILHKESMVFNASMLNFLQMEKPINIIFAVGLWL